MPKWFRRAGLAPVGLRRERTREHDCSDEENHARKVVLIIRPGDEEAQWFDDLGAKTA